MQPGLVAVALTVAIPSRWLRRARQDLVCLGCFRGYGWHVGVCPRAGRAVVSILSVAFRFLEPCLVCRRWPTALLGVFGRSAICACACWACIGYKPVVLFLWWLPRQFSFAQCSALEGLSVRQVVTVTWDPQPRASVRGSSPGSSRAQLVWVSEVVQALVRCRPASPSHCLALCWFRSHVGRWVQHSTAIAEVRNEAVD
ncbi:hypothetical protein Taro_034147 [Colocasia esculenta]|uniref:Uncharacterized protein n=1 Tax=Colocasia esculenta TaxID=4460 RepID=A0A843VVP3_COLES|nr:hypothetical protein [Colocasia esculenta]